MFAFIVGTAVTGTFARTVAPVAAPILAPALQAQPTFTITTQNEQLQADLYNQVAPSVVSINVIARSEGNNFQSQNGFVSGTGTGFVIDTAGHIVTNDHVVQGAERIEVNFFDGRIARAEIVGNDPDSDLAVIQVSDVPVEALIPVTLGNSDNAFVGQEVIAIGSPFGQAWTMTSGIISALGRTIDGLGDFSIGAVIQTDAAINPGNSGGPLLNLQGEVIGVNAQIISRTESSAGIGFAIPVNLVKRVSQSLIDFGDVDYSFLGITGDQLNLYYLDASGLSNDTRGVVIADVINGGPADQAGLQDPSNDTTVDGFQIPSDFDLVTAVDGTPVTDMGSLVAYLSAYTQPGQTVNMTVIRDGETLQLPVTLGSRD